jgi:hypothetical protein
VLSFHSDLPVDSPGGPPPLPGDKPNGCIDLAAMMDAKFWQTKELLLNFGK